MIINLANPKEKSTKSGEEILGRRWRKIIFKSRWPMDLAVSTKSVFFILRISALDTRKNSGHILSIQNKTTRKGEGRNIDVNKIMIKMAGRVM
jgi:hypothetical protein